MRVRETIRTRSSPRREVVLIDLTPEALLERLRAGKIYAAERIEAALDNFFRIENLAALREVALRQVAEEVGAKRLTTELVGSREESSAAGAPGRRRDTLLAVDRALPRRPAARASRVAFGGASGRGARSAVRAPGKQLSDEEQRSLAALRELASVLGATHARGGIRRSDERRRRGRLATWDDVHPDRRLAPRASASRACARRCRSGLMQRLPGVDVRIVADRSQRANGGSMSGG